MSLDKGIVWNLGVQHIKQEYLLSSDPAGVVVSFKEFIVAEEVVGTH